MIGTIVNAIAVIVGCFIGMLGKKWISTKISETVFTGLALCTLYIGITGILSGQNVLVIILSMVIGGAVGEWIDLDKWMIRLSESLEKRFTRNGDTVSIAQGFLTASLLFCVGAMTIVGSIESGLSGNHEILYAKSALDFTAAIVYASTLGIGVAFSAAFILLYQGAITLLAQYLAPLLSDTVVLNEISAVGSLIIIALALNMLKLTKIKVANFVPAIFMPALIYALIALFTKGNVL